MDLNAFFEGIHIAIAGLTAIILFVFGLEGFSREIERISGDRMREFLARSTRIPLVAVLIGALFTAVVQSSSATSVIAISLVNAGVLSFKNSVGLIFGANVGTTVTAQLVAFKLTAFAPILIIVGFVLSLMHTRYSVFSKTIFYFGFVFFSLNLISSSLAPLQANESLVGFLQQPQNPFLAILVGMLFTSLIQSSSVTTGLAIIFTQQGILGLENAVPLIMGANIGTTATALISIFNMDVAAKKTALSHFLFNVGGVLIFLPILLLFGSKLSEVQVDPAIALANIHLVFNVGTSVIFLLFIHPFTRFVDRVLGEGKMDFQRIEMPQFDEKITFVEIREKLQHNMRSLYRFLQENYSLVTLSIETNYEGVFDAAAKRIEYVGYFKRGLVSFFARVVSRVNEENESRELLALITRFDYLFQIHDSIVDLYNVKRTMHESYVELRSDILLIVRGLSSETLELFENIHDSIFDNEKIDIRAKSHALQEDIDSANRQLLILLADPARSDAGALINFITYTQRLKDKLINFTELEKQQELLFPDEAVDVAANSAPADAGSPAVDAPRT